MTKNGDGSQVVICSNCGYKRRSDEDAPLWQCPKCGMAYNKTSRNTVNDRSSGEKPRKFMVSHLVVLAVGVIVGWGLSEVRNSANPPAVATTRNSVGSAKETSREELIPENRVTGAAPTDMICNRKFLDGLENNENLTKLQKDHRVVEMCAGRAIRVKGSVTRADFQTSFEIKDAEGVEWDLKLVAGHHCGNLLYLTKGQDVAATGVIKNGYAHLTRFYLVNADCVTN